MCRALWKVFKLLIIYLLNFSLLQAGEIKPANHRRFRISGNHVFNQKQIENIIGIPNRETGTAEIENLLAQYLEKGYGDASVTCSRQDSVLVLSIHEGKPYTVNDIRVTGIDGINSKDYIEELRLKKGAFMNAGIFESDVRNILQKYGESGYAFASIYPHFTKIQGDSALLIELEIDEGEKSSVESVEIRGTRFTSKRIAKHCSALSPGNVFNEKKLLIGKKRLLDLGYYELVSEPFVLKGSRYSLVKILYHATEFRNNSIEGILGYSPSTKQDEKGFFTGLLNLSLLNLFGSARDFRIFWKRSSPEVFEIRASYLEHWFLGSPVDVELEMNQFVQDSTYLEDILGIKGKMNVFYRTSLYTQVTRERVVSGSVSDPRNRIPECRTLGLGAGFSFDSRDNPVDPSSGYRVNMESLFKFRNEEQLEASTIKTREAVPYSFLETYLPLKKNLTGFMKISCKAVLSTIKPLKAYSLFRIGGTETLRGYRESEFYAQKAVWTRMELRQPLSGKAKVFMFWDAALMENVSGRNAGKHGFGIGLTSWTRIGDLEVAYGIGSGDRLSDGKIHVKLNNRF